MKKILSQIIQQVLFLLAFTSIAHADFALQLAVFPSKSLAEGYVKSLIVQNYKPFIHVKERKNPDRGFWYKVRLGPFATKKTALEQIKTMLASGFKGDILVVGKRSKDLNMEKGMVPTEISEPETIETETIEAKPEKEERLQEEGLLTLNFRQVEIRELLSALSVQRELNIVMAKDVSGRVSVHLYRMTLERVLDAITLAGGFSYTKYGDVYYFFKPKEVKDPMAQQLKMRIFRLKYAEVDKVQEILDAIPGMRMIKIHESSKTLIVEDTPENIEKIEILLSYWDAKPKQVMIEAKILEISLTDDMSLGVDWQKMLGDATIGTAGFSSVNLPTTPGTPPSIAEGAAFMGNIITGAGSSTQFAAALNALRSITKVNTLSTPKILAIHGKQARVQVGGQQGYPVSTTSEGVLTQSVEFIPTGTTLNITPYIDDDGNVLLEVKPEISSVTLSSSGIPTVQTTNVSTWLLAKDGQTVFMGGLIKDTKSKTREMIPCLGNIPGVGALFGRIVQSFAKTVLVLVILPNIISSENKDLDHDVIDKTRAMEQELIKGTKSPIKEFLNN